MEGAAAGESEVTEALYFGLVGEAARERGERPYGGRQKKNRNFAHGNQVWNIRSNRNEM